MGGTQPQKKLHNIRHTRQFMDMKYPILSFLSYPMHRHANHANPSRFSGISAIPSNPNQIINVKINISLHPTIPDQPLDNENSATAFVLFSVVFCGLESHFSDDAGDFGHVEGGSNWNICICICFLDPRGRSIRYYCR